jgi:hypothetical protein
VEYVMLIYETPEDFDSRSPERRETFMAPWRAYHKALVDAGVYVTGAPLQPDSTGTTIRVKGGQRQVQDGPYADTKEQLGGFIILDLPSLDAALEWAARCPTAGSGAVEVRPVSEDVRRWVEHGPAR